jgi:hypothetical protein
MLTDKSAQSTNGGATIGLLLPICSSQNSPTRSKFSLPLLKPDVYTGTGRLRTCGGSCSEGLDTMCITP